MDFFSRVDDKSRCQQRLTIPSRSSDSPTALAGLTPKQGRKVRAALPECCPWVPLFSAYPLSNDSWQLLGRKQRPQFFLPFLLSLQDSY